MWRDSDEIERAEKIAKRRILPKFIVVYTDEDLK
jgi:hypothetical protein